jgi:hypothetical protein
MLESSSRGLNSTPAAHQVNDQHYDGNYQQQVNETAGYVEAKAEKPQNQKHNKNSPEHVDLLCSFDRPKEGLSVESSSILMWPARAIFRTPGKTTWTAM